MAEPVSFSETVRSLVENPGYVKVLTAQIEARTACPGAAPNGDPELSVLSARHSKTKPIQSVDMKRLFASIAVAIILSPVAYGQLSERLQTFDAADVHASPRSANPNTVGGFIRGGRYVFRNATMVDLIASAYGLEAEKVLGGPSWLESDRFDILAKAPASTSNDTARLMLRSLLADRFKLVLHNEDRGVAVYALTAGKRGPQLREADGSGPSGCQGVPQTPAPGEIPQNVVSCRNMTMATFAETLRQMAGGYLDKQVVDLTDLKGAWDLTLKWTTRALMANAGSDGISIFDAVDKQLGLKLDVKTRPAPVIVVDSVNQRPTDNLPDVAKNLPVISTEFEVADIKPSMPGTNGRRGSLQPGGRIDLGGFTLKNFMSLAWDLPEDMIVGPKFIDTDRFDIVAKAPADVALSGQTVDVDTLRAMLRATLVDRFKIVTHTEDQPVPVFVLLAPKTDTRLKKADPSARAGCKRVVPPPNAVASALSATMTCQNTTMAQLAERLPNVAGAYVTHPAVDSTGIAGGWDFTLNWTPLAAFQVAPRPADGTQPGGAAVATDPNGGLTVFEAIDKQLGLKLEQQKRPMPVLVIDHVEQKPTDN
jgi:uncharacterized protein (TIGR03435 family)